MAAWPVIISLSIARSRRVLDAVVAWAAAHRASGSGKRRLHGLRVAEDEDLDHRHADRAAIKPRQVEQRVAFRRRADRAC